MAKGQRYIPTLRHFCPLPFHLSLLTFNFSLRPGRGARGFTLLEILVALAIMSIVVLGFLRGNSQMITNADYLREKTLAGWVAMNRATEAEQHDDLTNRQIAGKALDEHVLQREADHREHHQNAAAQIFHRDILPGKAALSAGQRTATGTKL